MDLTRLVADSQKLHKTLVDSLALPSCLNCEHYHRDTEVCRLANERPPAKVLVYSCGAKYQPEPPF